MASTSIQRTPSSAGNRRKFTLSVWCKKHSSSQMNFIGTGGSGDQNHIQFASDRFQIRHYAGGTTIIVNTKALLRDPNAWYHVVCSVDTTQATDTNRVKLYVNGQLAELEDTTYPSQNYDWDFNDTTLHTLGRRSFSVDYLFDGIMSHFHWIDGTAYDASPFGSTDSTTGQWKINISPSVTYGTNGFFLFKDNASVTDQSGNSNNWSSTGSLTKTEDCPDNNFAIMNELSKGSDITVSNGNTVVTNSQTSDQSIVGSIACGNGKYYWEAKCTSNTSNYSNIGITLSSKFGGNHSGVDSGRVMWSSNGNLYREGLGLGAVSLGALGTNDIIGVALDTENGTLKFFKGGVLIHTETNNSFLYSNNEYIPASGLRDGGGWNYNFGNGFFGVTAVSSAGTNASGLGIFEYDVPTGYTALCTKGLNL